MNKYHGLKGKIFLSISVMALMYVMIFVVGCSSNETGAVSSDYQIKFIGVPTFGKVQIGSVMETRIQFTNNTSGPVSIQTVNDFDMTKSSTDAMCVWPDVPPKYACTYKFVFSPSIKGVFNHTYSLVGSLAEIKSESILPANIVLLSSATIGIGDVEAGTTTNSTIQIQNSGERPTEFILKNKPSYLTVIGNSCDSTIAPQQICNISITLVPQLKTAALADIFSVETVDQTVDITVTGSVRPSTPYGDILVPQNTPNLFHATDGWVTITTDPIKDIYGNVVDDGTAVLLFFSEVEAQKTTGENLATGAALQTALGSVSFKVRAPPATASLANGEIRLVSTPASLYIAISVAP